MKMGGMQIILVVLIACVLVAGAGVTAYAILHASREEKPKLFLIGISVLGAGGVFGYMVITLFLALEGQSH